MNTIFEEDEEKIESEAGPSTSTLESPNDYQTGVVEKYIKERKKAQKSSQNLIFKETKPPKWICTVQNCKWGGRSMEMMTSHLKKCHPGETGTQFALETKFHYDSSRKGSLKHIKTKIREKIVIDELGEKIKDL
ncbi:hypothetical protein L5515_003179 [Caenorhabditis briggsae]|uniref:Uncharacterized protein n=1 Tax=Caenorhabditis briggsae TaxID=6238 RepID=A0AAE9EH16_CAEBR|nr:hypothetical protein L5515_003179 [Caenorhabditis briggsae]